MPLTHIYASTHAHTTHYSYLSTLWQGEAKDCGSQGTPEGSYEQRGFSTVHMGDFPDKLPCTSPGLVCLKNPHEGPDADVATMQNPWMQGGNAALSPDPTSDSPPLALRFLS